MIIPRTLANGPGNWPDADKFMDNYNFLAALLGGNKLLNSSFELWSDATTFSSPVSSTPVADLWFLSRSGTSAPTFTVARDTGADEGEYAAKIDVTAGGSADSRVNLYQDLPDFIHYVGRSIYAGVRVKTSASSKVRVGLTDGVTTAYSAYHSGDGEWATLTASLTVSESATTVRLVVESVSDAVYAWWADDAFLLDVVSGISDTAKASLPGALVPTRTPRSHSALDPLRGWEPIPLSLAYDTASRFLVVGDLTAAFEVGDRIRLDNGGTTKYFFVVGIQLSGGTTLVSVTGGSAYSLANSAITNPYSSKEARPAGFPSVFEYSPTVTGFSANPAGKYYFSILGRVVTLWLAQSASGTSNATTFSLTLPVTAGGVSGDAWDAKCGIALNNGAAAENAYMEIINGGGSVDLYLSIASGNWTASGGKMARGSIAYFI